MLVLLDKANKFTDIERYEVRDEKDVRNKKEIVYVWNSNEQNHKSQREVKLIIGLKTNDVTLKITNYFVGLPNAKPEVKEYHDCVESIWQAQYFMLTHIKEYLAAKHIYDEHKGRVTNTYVTLLHIHNYIAECQKNIKDVLKYRTESV